jgi:Holliday junction resolvase RusA-like endonuclease
MDKGGIAMDTCVICGGYTPEGRHVCRGCELTRPKELVQIMSKKTDTIIIPGELPDLNQIIAETKGHWGNYSTLKKTNTQIVAYCAKQTTKQKYKKIDLDITWHCKNKRKDKDNIMAGGLKMILDGLVVAGVIKNDGWSEIGSINNHFEVDKDNPRVEVKITEVMG